MTIFGMFHTMFHILKSLKETSRKMDIEKGRYTNDFVR